LKYGLKKIQSPSSISAFIAQAIVERKILCIFRGRSEVGPRALGIDLLLPLQLQKIYVMG